jgi:hypothetical protein
VDTNATQGYLEETNALASAMTTMLLCLEMSLKDYSVLRESCTAETKLMVILT